MIPDKRTTFEPDDSTVGDRLFSQLPLDDRWRLIKEALRTSRESAALPYIPYYFPSPLAIIRFAIVSFAAVVSLLVFAIPLKYVSASFKLWCFLQFCVILVLQVLAERFDRKVRRETYLIAKSLSEVEAITLRESGEPGGAA